VSVDALQASETEVWPEAVTVRPVGVLGDVVSDDGVVDEAVDVPG
jgi:hypothetical protein